MGLLPCGSRVVRVVLYAVLLVATLAPWATGQGSTQILVITGDVAPQASDMFTGLSIPALNNAGHVSFHASLTGAASKNEGIYRAGGPGPTVQIARKGQSDGGLGSLSGFSHSYPLPINNLGQVAFHGTTDVIPAASLLVRELCAATLG
jgi:hypothetical protein